MRVRQGAAAVLIAALLVTPSYAITANDIRSAYGVGLSKDITPIIEEQRQLREQFLEAQRAELRNAVLSEVTPEELDVKLWGISNELTHLYSDISSGIDMPFEEMLSQEARYYKLETEANFVLSQRDALAVYAPVEVEIDSSTLQLSIDQLQAEINTAGHYDNIGEKDVWPVVGVKRHVNSEFGSRWDPITNSSYSYHQGIDLYAPMSTSVIAEFSGTVYSTGYSNGSGYFIYLDHGYGVKTFYCHLSKILCSKGDNVTQGTEIAKSGNTGTRTTGPHLHFGVYIDGQACNPRSVLPDV